MLKRFFALSVAMLMLAGLCVPTFAYEHGHGDVCTCDEPWPENPEEYGVPYIISSGYEVHVWAQDYIYQCSRCNLYFVVVAEDTVPEEHVYPGDFGEGYEGIDSNTCIICGYER
jgi:hypothetical protein